MGAKERKTKVEERRRIKRNLEKLKGRRAFSRIGEQRTGRENIFCLQWLCILIYNFTG